MCVNIVLKPCEVVRSVVGDKKGGGAYIAERNYVGVTGVSELVGAGDNFDVLEAC